MNKILASSTLLAVLAMGAVSARATLLSHDDFSAYANDGITQLDDDIPSPVISGYVSNWVHASTSFGSGDIVSQPGGYVSGNDGFAETTSGRVARQLDASISATSNSVGTLYLGWLFKVNGTSGLTYEMLALYDGIGNTDSDASRNFDAGATDNGGMGGAVYSFGVDNSYISSGIALDTGWHLMVAKFVLSSNAASDEVTVWLDPASEGDSSFIASSKDLIWDTLTLSDYDESSGFWDDIKWGTTFADVLTTVPANPPSFGAKSPEGGTTNATPTITAEVVDGTFPVDTNSIALYLDNVQVSTVVSQSVDTTINYVSYTVPSPLAVGSHHTVKIVADDTEPSIAAVSNSWAFSIVAQGSGVYITSTTNAPGAGADDIAQFVAPGMDWDNIDGVVSTNAYSGDNDPSTYVANDRLTQGQIFTTGSTSAGYELSSVWVKNVLYTNDLPTGNGTFAGLNPGDDVTIRIVDPSQTNTANFVVYSEALTVVSNSISVSGGLGTGYWMEYRLSVPVALDANKQYGFDLTSYGPYFELAGMGTNDWYGGGDAYTTATKEALNLGTVHPAADRTFLINLTPTGPTVVPDIQSIVISGGSATLTWQSEIGASYGVMSKSSLTAGSWTAVTNVSGAGASTMATVPAASSKEFFRIEGN